MFYRAILLSTLLGIGACSATPASFGITGPGIAPPPTFKPLPANDDSAVGQPGLPDSGSQFAPSLLPAGDAATPGGFYGYN
jgi:hypothetical protein